MSTPLDAHGQPISPAFNAQRLRDRTVDEFIGLCRGALLDGQISDGEARGLKAWLDGNSEHAHGWPFSVLYPRLAIALVDGKVDAGEAAELTDIVKGIVGGDGSLLEADLKAAATSLPINKPPPDIVFQDRSFVVTGKFAFGQRKAVEAEIAARAGLLKSSVSPITDYLVVGLIGSAQWQHSSFGRKIEDAVRYREDGRPLAIVCEQHWMTCLAKTPRRIV